MFLPWVVQPQQPYFITPLASVYMLCSRETFNALSNWLSDARTLASPNIIIVLVGNKRDLDAEREVTFLEASRFAQENGIHILLSVNINIVISCC